jgi:hypothetical protein
MPRLRPHPFLSTSLLVAALVLFSASTLRPSLVESKGQTRQAQEHDLGPEPGHGCRFR